MTIRMRKGRKVRGGGEWAWGWCRFAVYKKGKQFLYMSIPDFAHEMQEYDPDIIILNYILEICFSLPRWLSFLLFRLVFFLQMAHDPGKTMGWHCLGKNLRYIFPSNGLTINFQLAGADGYEDELGDCMYDLLDCY